MQQYLGEHFDDQHKRSLQLLDTDLLKQMNSILQFDQYIRMDWKMDSNLTYRQYIGRYGDSVNFQRVKALIEASKFIGYKNSGAKSLDFLPVLTHIGDHNEENWNYLFNVLKKEVMAGNISPVLVSIIVDRHYTGSQNKKPCSYYGRWQGRKLDLCDCKNVDKIRDEIGLPDLKTEYEIKKIKIPECYENK